MLAHLHIEHYALIAELDIDWANQFVAITGETGAGKSILLGALSLLMGARADSKVISQGFPKCVVEADFEVSHNQAVQALLQENDLDDLPLLTLRREVSESGKSRAFINDTPVNLALLKTFSEHLIDIHSQHANLLLQQSDFQRLVVDSVAQNAPQRQQYAAAYQQYEQTLDAYQELQLKSEQSQKDLDYLRFQYDQLQKAHLVAGEEERLEQEQRYWDHQAEIESAFAAALALLQGDETGVLSSLQTALQLLRPIAAFLPESEPWIERLNSCEIDLKDLADTFEHFCQNQDFDPNRKAEVEARLDLINTLMQKHKVNSVAQLLALQENWGNQLQTIESYDQTLQQLQAQIQDLLRRLAQCADCLTQSRQKVAPLIANRLQAQLLALGMEHAKMEIQLSPIPFAAHGQDEITFRFAANKNQLMQPVSAVASGGEMARIMLSIKALMANSQSLPTILFDEIDTGISGEVASHMGAILHQMGQERQVMAITHLPQIAACADAHYKVFKQDTDQTTQTHICRLSASERVEEIAQMLSGSTISEAARANARILLNQP